MLSTGNMHSQGVCVRTIGVNASLSKHSYTERQQSACVIVWPCRHDVTRTTQTCMAGFLDERYIGVCSRFRLHNEQL